MSENGVMNRKQIRKFERHSQEFISWMLKFNVIHERRLLNDAIENIFSMSSHNSDVQQTWESVVA